MATKATRFTSTTERAQAHGDSSSSERSSSRPSTPLLRCFVSAAGARAAAVSTTALSTSSGERS
jgi:hypothetical protein